jgi:plastocyanin
MLYRTDLTRWLSAALAATSLGFVSAADASAATIKGTVQFVGGAVDQKKLPVTVDQFVCGKDKDAEDLVLSPQRGIRNAVVSLASPPPGAKWEFSTAPVFLDQKQCSFTPRVILVPAGGTVEFLNSDRLLHNLHSASKSNPAFNRTQPKGRAIPITFAKPEIVRIGCDLHGWMRSWVVVIEHPFYAVTGAAGEFALNNVPPGKYTLTVWQETLGTLTKDVTVGDADATVVLEMGRR